MKKFLPLLFALLMVLSLSACGGNAEPGVEERYGLDMTSTEEQPMSEEKLDWKTLGARAHDYFGGMTFFSGSDFEKMTYEDVKNVIGVDANIYCYDEENAADMFTWNASDKSTAKLAFWFREGKLYALGSTNLI